MTGRDRRPTRRGKCERAIGHLLAMATTAGGATTAVSHPTLEMILTQISISVGYALAWSMHRHRLRLVENHQRLQRQLIARALADPENEHLRLLLIVHAATFPGR
jgi:hypothetical protein